MRKTINRNLFFLSASINNSDMSGIDDVLNEIDALRLRHVDSLRKCFGKTADDPMPTKDMVQRVLICDAAEGETVTTDYGALIKLLKTNIKNLQHLRNKALTYASTMMICADSLTII